MERYSIITSKNPREILLLRGSGCKWRRCAFCDYHLDFAIDEESNFELNRIELAKVVGVYGKLEIINSGSFVDLDSKTMNMIIDVCINKSIFNYRTIRRTPRQRATEGGESVGMAHHKLEFSELKLL